MNKYLKILGNMPVFDKSIFFDVVKEKENTYSDRTLEKILNANINAGNIARVGRNAYCIQGDLKQYRYEYCELSNHIANILYSDFYHLDFRIMELYQLNRFLNHQIAHNAIFVFVEKDISISVFERLKKDYAGRVLINPSEKDFFNYRLEDIIVVKNLLTESPKGKTQFWHTDLEKLLVDLFSDKLLKEMFSESELPSIFETSFANYIIDESKMFRYAKRRKADKRIKQFIDCDTTVKLRLYKEL